MSVEDILSSQIITIVLFKLWSFILEKLLRNLPSMLGHFTTCIADWLDDAIIIKSIAFIIPVAISLDSSSNTSNGIARIQR